MRKENLRFNAELQFETVKLENVPCEIFFPKTQNEKIILEAQFNRNECVLSEISFVFSLKASFSNGQNRLVEISVGKVYTLSIETSYLPTNQDISILKAEPVDLKIQEFNQDSEDNKAQKSFYFWLTQSIQLAPFNSSKRDYYGNVSVKNYTKKEFEIVEGLKFSFIDYYFHDNDPKRKNKWASEPVLAAQFLGITEHELGENIFPEIVMFLNLVSFSERRRVVCYGYTGYLNHKNINFYRGDVTIPEENFDHSHNQCLINSMDFEKFMLKALETSKNCIFKKHLFAAIGKAIDSEYLILDSEYLSYYSALENLVNGYRDTCNFHYILELDDYKEFSKDLKSFIKKHNLFKDNNESKELRRKNRELIYKKIPELNRISFGTVFDLFCESYQIDLSDLWSLGGGNNHTSLTDIRNRLIHGGRFERAEYDAVICANNHLKWTLERCILRVLDWDIEQSNVRPLFLTHHAEYNAWKEKSSLLTSRFS